MKSPREDVCCMKVVTAVTLSLRYMGWLMTSVTTRWTERALLEPLDVRILIPSHHTLQEASPLRKQVRQKPLLSHSKRALAGP